MKQFIRWLMLVVFTLSIGLWISSYYYSRGIALNSPASYYVIANHWGGMMFAATNKKNPVFSIGWHLIFEKAEKIAPVSPIDFCGFQLGLVSGSRNLYISIPFWFIVTTLFLLTLKLWYHPIKNWWRGTNRQGFAVEVIEKKEDSAKSA